MGTDENPGSLEIAGHQVHLSRPASLRTTRISAACLTCGRIAKPMDLTDAYAEDMLLHGRTMQIVDEVSQWLRDQHACAGVV